MKIAAIENIPHNDEHENNETNEYDMSDVSIPTSEPKYYRHIKIIYQTCIELSKEYDNGDRDNHQHSTQIAKKL